MSGPKADPKGFVDCLLDIAGHCCEDCGRAGSLSVHHIWPRSTGRTIHKIWNCIVLGMDCGCHKSGKYEDKIRLFDLRLRRLQNYCALWNKKPNKEWTRLESGVFGQQDTDRLRTQLREAGIDKN